MAGSGSDDAGLPAVAIDASADPAADPCGNDGGIPDELGCTGLYAPRSRDLATGVMPYTPGLVFYSDGADKSRWLKFPDGATIDTASPDGWIFPVGTKAWKEFRVAGKKIETRLLWKVSEDKWVAVTYVWNEEQTLARRQDNGVENALGTGYNVPDQAKCEHCHGGGSDTLLGVEALSLGLPAAEGATLGALAQKGLLSVPPAHTKLSLPEDSTGKAGAALGYLHVNCGVTCHNSNQYAAAGFTGLDMKLRTSDCIADGGAGDAGKDAGPKVDGSVDVSAYSSAQIRATNAWTTGAGRKPEARTDFVDAGFYRLMPGDSAHSLVPHLLSLPRDQSGSMPPIGPSTVEDAGVGTVRTWLDGLKKNGG